MVAGGGGGDGGGVFVVVACCTRDSRAVFTFFSFEIFLFLGTLPGTFPVTFSDPFP